MLQRVILISMKKLFEKLGISDAVVVQPKQVHENRVAVIDRDMRKEAVAEGKYSFIRPADTDAVVTDESGVLLTTVHADCLPVYFYDREKQSRRTCACRMAGER